VPLKRVRGIAERSYGCALVANSAPIGGITMSAKLVFVPLFALLAACDHLGGGSSAIEPVAMDEGAPMLDGDASTEASVESSEPEAEALADVDTTTPEAKRRKAQAAASSKTPGGDPALDDLINGTGEAARQDEINGAGWDGGSLEGAESEPATAAEGL
jgi:hypothetical protein